MDMMSVVVMCSSLYKLFKVYMNIPPGCDWERPLRGQNMAHWIESTLSAKSYFAMKGLLECIMIFFSE